MRYRCLPLIALKDPSDVHPVPSRHMIRRTGKFSSFFVVGFVNTLMTKDGWFQLKKQEGFTDREGDQEAGLRGPHVLMVLTGWYMRLCGNYKR